MISENEFELIFNINSNEKIYFDNLEPNLSIMIKKISKV